jgi:precorrin-6A/cobalt-precorrin-6A reductase
MAPTRILILGGTTEARQLATRLAQRADLEVTLSLAGRTERPVAHAVPVRVGGFGGVEGLAAHLRETGTDLLIDATHPYASRMSANAAVAAALAGVPLVALRRHAWMPVSGDRWIEVDGSDDTVERLGAARRRVFVALGRQELLPFENAPQHAYLIRSVDPVQPPLALPDATYVLARGPFDQPGETALLQDNRIDTIVCKNSGGDATYAKLAAARKLGIAVLMFRRPPLPDVPSVATVEEAVAAIDHCAGSAAKRGV